MIEDEVFPDGLYVKLTCGDQQISKRLMSGGDNKISLEGIIVSIDRRGYTVASEYVGAGGGCASVSKNAIGVCGAKSTAFANGGVAVGSSGASGGIAVSGGGAAYGAAGGSPVFLSPVVSCGNILSAHTRPKTVTIQFGEDAPTTASATI